MSWWIDVLYSVTTLTRVERLLLLKKLPQAVRVGIKCHREKADHLEFVPFFYFFPYIFWQCDRKQQCFLGELECGSIVGHSLLPTWCIERKAILKIHDGVVLLGSYSSPISIIGLTNNQGVEVDINAAKVLQTGR